jgi:hypothetical protein
MIGFIGTSLQLQLIITAHTLNSLLMTSVWRISLDLDLLDRTLHWLSIILGTSLYAVVFPFSWCCWTASSNSLIQLVPASQNQSQSHIATDRLSVSKSWCRAPSGAHDQIFITVWQLRYFFLWGALSNERTGVSFVYAAGPCQCSLSRVRVPCLRFETSLFVASYDSQG